MANQSYVRLPRNTSKCYLIYFKLADIKVAFLLIWKAYTCTHISSYSILIFNAYLYQIIEVILFAKMIEIDAIPFISDFFFTYVSWNDFFFSSVEMMFWLRAYLSSMNSYCYDRVWSMYKCDFSKTETFFCSFFYWSANIVVFEGKKFFFNENFIDLIHIIKGNAKQMIDTC